MRVVIAGQGYVGLPLAVRAAECGHQVVGYDVDERRIGMLHDGRSYVEDITDERLAAAVASGRYRATTAVRDCAGFEWLYRAAQEPRRLGGRYLSTNAKFIRLVVSEMFRTRRAGVER